jgi:hypothetical protein
VRHSRFRCAGAVRAPGDSGMPSSVIKRSEYDPERRVLTIWFVPSGRAYDYRDVPQRVYDRLRHATSKGRFFNAHIRDRYAFTQRESATE